MKLKMFRSGRWALSIGLLGVVLVLGMTGWMLLRPNSSPIPSNAITATEREELERRAAAGDPAAQYSLTLLLDDEHARSAMLRKAAEGGHPPALVTYALKLAENGAGDAARSRGFLERAAKKGYYPAVKELAHCLEQATCGAADRQAAMAWSLVSGRLRESGAISIDDLAATRVRLEPTLTPRQMSAARELANRLTRDIESQR